MSNRLDKPKKNKWLKFAEFQEAYRASHKIPKPVLIDTFTFVPAHADLSRGYWYVWRTEEEYKKGRDVEIANEMRRKEQLAPSKGPRPVRIPMAIARWVHHKAMVVPLQFAASINLPRNWPRGEAWA